MELDDYIALLNAPSNSGASANAEQQQPATSSTSGFSGPQENNLFLNDLAFWTQADFASLEDDGFTKDITAAALHGSVDLSELLGHPHQSNSLNMFSNMPSAGSSSSSVVNQPAPLFNPQQSAHLQQTPPSAISQPLLLQQYVNALAAVATAALQQQVPSPSSVASTRAPGETNSTVLPSNVEGSVGSSKLVPQSQLPPRIDDRKLKRTKTQHWKAVAQSRHPDHSSTLAGTNISQSNSHSHLPLLNHEQPSRHSSSHFEHPLPSLSSHRGNVSSTSQTLSETQNMVSGSTRKSSRKKATAVLVIPPEIAAATGTPTILPAPAPLDLTNHGTDGDNSALSASYIDRVKRTPITDAEEKRKRNTEASARFRAKKKAREHAVAQTAHYLQSKLDDAQKRIRDQEMEIKWLRSMLIEKSEDGIVRLEEIYRQNGLKLEAGTVAALDPSEVEGSVSSAVESVSSV